MSLQQHVFELFLMDFSKQWQPGTSLEVSRPALEQTVLAPVCGKHISRFRHFKDINDKEIKLHCCYPLSKVPSPLDCLSLAELLL